MRNLLLFGGALLLLGLTTAFAASFEVDAEDVQSFSSSTSISVPNPPPIAFPSTVYVRGDSDTVPGSLDLVPPESNDAVQSKTFLLSTETLQAQTDEAKYFTWLTPAAPSQGYLLAGTIRLLIEQNENAADRMTAGLFDCEALTDPNSADTSNCSLIVEAVGGPGANANSNGFQERIVSFGTIPATIIPEGHQLRLKIVNRDQQPAGTVVSTSDWDLQWGFLPARQSRLEITTS